MENILNCMKLYIIHVIEYQYRGLLHAHLVFRVDNAHDIDTNNHEDLIDFVNRRGQLNVHCVGLYYSN